MIVDNGLNAIIATLNGQSPQVLNYIAIGDDPSSTTYDDVKLHNEVFRTLITSIYQSNGSIVVETYLDKTQANFTWREIGLICGGTADLNSGTLLARTTLNEAKNNKKTANIIWEIKIQRS